MAKPDASACRIVRVLDREQCVRDGSVTAKRDDGAGTSGIMGVVSAATRPAAAFQAHGRRNAGPTDPPDGAETTTSSEAMRRPSTFSRFRIRSSRPAAKGWLKARPLSSGFRLPPVAASRPRRTSRTGSYPAATATRRLNASASNSSAPTLEVEEGRLGCPTPPTARRCAAAVRVRSPSPPNARHASLRHPCASRHAPFRAATPRARPSAPGDRPAQSRIVATPIRPVVTYSGPPEGQRWWALLRIHRANPGTGYRGLRRMCNQARQHTVEKPSSALAFVTRRMRRPSSTADCCPSLTSWSTVKRLNPDGDRSDRELAIRRVSRCK